MSSGEADEPEDQLWTMAPDGVSLHTSRIFFADLATFANPPGPENATDLLARLPLQAIIYAWTIGSYLLGTTGEHELVRRVERHSNGIPVLMSALAATAAFRALEAERIALVDGPFFTDDHDQEGVAYFQERTEPLISFVAGGGAGGYLAGFAR
jgi:maleate isomerase